MKAVRGKVGHVWQQCKLWQPGQLHDDDDDDDDNDDDDDTNDEDNA